MLAGCGSLNSAETKTVRFADVYHVMVNTKKEAEDVYTQLKSLDEKEQFEEFKKLAKSVSIDTGSADKGGHLGIIFEGMLDIPFESGVFSSHQGEVSPRFQSSFGWHVIYVQKFYKRTLDDICKTKNAVQGEISPYSYYCL